MNITMNRINFLHVSFDNDDMKPSKCQVSFILLIFVLKYLEFITIKTAGGEEKKNQMFDRVVITGIVRRKL